MKITPELVTYLQDLSCLTLDDTEKSALATDLEAVLAHAGIIGSLDTQGVPECSHPFDCVNAFRDDTPLPSYDRELILQNAPERNDTMFIAPKTIE
jgi:aspartyl-tRNA(Asn)/glutamyl-tRNA(Gln) amidotransferase subunit C